mgnify:CR=1 FL=1
MKQIYFKFNNEEEFNILQDILLELGYEWLDSGKRRIKYRYYYSYIYIISLKNNILSFTINEKKFYI